MGKSTISMAIFNSYVKLPEGKTQSSPIKICHGTGQTAPASPTQTAAQEWNKWRDPGASKTWRLNLGVVFSGIQTCEKHI